MELCDREKKRWIVYEKEKRQIAAKNLSAAEYELEIQRLIERLGL